MDIEAVKTRFEVDKIKLINKKNIFVTKKEELQAELTEAAAATPTTNIQTFITIAYNKLKAKRPLPFDRTKETFQRFFIKTHYYYKFYNQNLPFDLNKV